MKTREKILNAMQALMEENNGIIPTNSEIAKKANIVKGGIYYYFKTKEEAIDALIDYTFANLLSQCKNITDDMNLKPIQKIENLFRLVIQYANLPQRKIVLDYLQTQQSSYFHIKSMKQSVLKMSPLIAEIIKQGIDENIFITNYPNEISEIIVSILTFLFDTAIFEWDKKQKKEKYIALAETCELLLRTPKGTFDFFTEIGLSK